MGKLRLGVLFGGVSSEHEVSLMSAASVLANLDREKYEIYMLGITKEGRWFLYEGDPARIRENGWCQEGLATPALLSPDRGTHGLLVLGPGTPRAVRLDVVFPVLHGKNGEDGTVQGLFELAGIPYVGCGVLASAACMDKEFTHQVLTHRGIANAKYICVHPGEMGGLGAVEERLRAAGLAFPVFVKPANGGSSVGISKAHGPRELEGALRTALREDSKAIVEECIAGAEVECAVMGNENPVAAGEVGEIEPLRELYDYEGKYCDDTTALHIPARIGPQAAAQVRQTAVAAYRALGCTGLARVDFFVRHGDGQVLLNEINTMPGFTNISMYPKLFCHGGMAYGHLLDSLVDFALGRAAKTPAGR